MYLFIIEMFSLSTRGEWNRRLERSVTKWVSLRDNRVKNGLDFDLSSDKTNIREDKIATGSIYWNVRVYNVARI